MHLLINTKSFFESLEECKATLTELSPPKKHTLTLALPASLIWYANTLLKGNPSIKLAAQDISEDGSGAFSGQENGLLLKDLGASSVLIGHPESRLSSALLEEDIASKIEQAVLCKLHPIIYIGSSFDAEGATLEDITRINLATISESKLKKCTIVIESSELITPDVLIALTTTIGQTLKHIEYDLLFAGGVDAGTVTNLKDKSYIDGFALSRNALELTDRQKLYDALD